MNTDEMNELEEMKQQALAVLDLALELGEKTAPRVARLYRLLFDELVKQGFTREEAIEIAKVAQIGGSKK